MPQISEQPLPLSCHRCGRPLTRGEGNFYLVGILAVADPWPPELTAEDLSADLSWLVNETVEELKDLSVQEAMDQVYRRVVVYLCNDCFAGWIEDPCR